MTTTGETRQRVGRAMMLHAEVASPLGGMYAVQCGCGVRPEGESFIDRKQALRQHQLDEVMAAFSGGPNP